VAWRGSEKNVGVESSEIMIVVNLESDFKDQDNYCCAEVFQKIKKLWRS